MANPEFEKLVTVASRTPRYDEGEIRGWDYHFVGERAFLKMKEAGDFLEYKNYGDDEENPDWKGTLKKSFLRVMESRNVIWRIDMSAAANVHGILKDKLSDEEYEAIAEKIVVVVLWEEPEVLEQRVRERDKDKFNEKRFNDRMRADLKVREENHFEHVVLNRHDQVEETINEILGILSERGDGVLLVLAGPTGVGKDTIVRKLVSLNEEN